MPEWEGCFHELIVSDTPRQYYPDILVRETKNDDHKDANVYRRNVDILDKIRQRRIETITADRYRQFAIDYQRAKRYEDAIEMFCACINHPGANAFQKLFCLYEWGNMYIALQQFQPAYEKYQEIAVWEYWSKYSH